MRIKVRGGAMTNGAEPLCHTCRFATIVRGAGLHDEIIECGQLGHQQQRITFPVTFCTKYVSSQHPSLHEMQATAWILRSDTKKKTVGFVRATDVAPRFRFMFDEDDL